MGTGEIARDLAVNVAPVLVEFLGLKAWGRIEGWEAHSAETLADDGVITRSQERPLAKWLRDINRAVLLRTLDGESDVLHDSLAIALFGDRPDGPGEVERRREVAREVSGTLWGPLLKYANKEMLDEMEGDSRQVHMIDVIRQIASRLEAMDGVDRAWREKAAELETDLGLLRWRIAEPVGVQPSLGKLLAARFDVVPFVGRNSQLKTLTDWLDGPSPLALQFIEGPGGSGKTRLAAELCRRQAANSGWVCGFLADHLTEHQLERLVNSMSPRLIVIDYAEARSDVAVLIENATQRTRARNKCRILLLEREHRNIGGTAEVHLAVSSALTQQLGTEQLSTTELIELFVSAKLAIAERMGTTAAPCTPNLGDSIFGHTLLVVVAAALSSDDKVPPPPLGSTAAVYSALLEHEERYWSGVAQQLGVRVRENLRHGLVACGAVFGWAGTPPGGAIASEAELGRYLAQAEACHEQDSLVAAEWLLEVYPGGRPPLDPFADYMIANYLPTEAYKVALQ